MHRAGRVGWAVAVATIASTAVVVVTQLGSWSGPTAAVPVIQVFTPHLGVVTILIAAVAFARQRLTILAAAIGVAAPVLWLALPVAFPAGQPAARPGATGLRVAALNVLYDNPRVDDFVDQLVTIDADVIAIAEFTTAHDAAMLASPLAARYPYRISHAVRGHGPMGAALWSRYPMTENDPPDTYTASIDVTVRGPDGPVRVVAVHLDSPIHDVAQWRDDLDTTRRLVDTIEGPTVVAGDFNASFWHPGFRRLLDAGFTDAHLALGDGMSTSWPRHLRAIPSFVRLDHALVAGGLVATDIVDVTIPGSDHRGFVVTVAPAR